jgi:uncharacterized protein
MMREELRRAEIVEFAEGDDRVLFFPRTLRFSRIDGKMLSILGDYRAGAEIEDLAEERNLDAGRVSASLAAISELSGECAAVRQERTAPAERRRAKLPKAVLMVNNYCNLKCRYCYQESTLFAKPAAQMPVEVLRSALSKLYSAFDSIGQIMFIGGEPSLSEAVIEQACIHANAIAGEKKCAAPGFCMISNGSRMTEGLFGIVKRFGIQVTFSIDGPKNVNDLVRIRKDNSGTYDDVVRNLKTYSRECGGKTGVESTLTRFHQDAGVTVRQTLEFCAGTLGVREPHITVAALPKGDPNRADASVMRWQFEEAAAFSMDNLLAEGKAAARLDMVGAFVGRLTKREPKLDMCPAGLAQIVVDVHGEVYPCWMFSGIPEYRMGNVLRDGIFDEPAQLVLERIERNSKDNNPRCRTCYARYLCANCIGNRHNENGCIEGCDEDYCERVRAVLRVVVLKLAGADAPARALASGMRQRC